MSEAAASGATNQADAPLVYCVVVNWNGWRDTVACVGSLLAQDYPSLYILVVDNASSDESVQSIRAAFPSLEILQTGKNRGFASGCNTGVRVARERGAKFVWLLNNDTSAPPDTLSKLVSAASDPAIGMVGTVLLYMKNPCQVQAWGGGSVRRWMGFVRHFREPATMGPNTFLTFASVLIRSELFETVGLLDEGFFMYFEDSDMCFRARATGWKIAVAPDTAVLHTEGGSAGQRKSARVDRIVTASGLRFLGRHGRPRELARVLFVLSRVGRRVLRADLAGVRAVLLGVRDWRRHDPMAFQEEP